MRCPSAIATLTALSPTATRLRLAPVSATTIANLFCQASLLTRLPVSSFSPIRHPALKSAMDTGIKREEIFLTSKLWNTKHNPADVKSVDAYQSRHFTLQNLTLPFIFGSPLLPFLQACTAKDPDGLGCIVPGLVLDSLAHLLQGRSQTFLRFSAFIAHGASSFPISLRHLLSL